ncbi:unnamed protein product [Cuscuta europaea]|uniref:Uncharacterized protein n=1 Tax=Cuscuta europaea TaxID=41803 RepID=A0A9P1E673_CUSEU|nr:unnamed protein product [Cuscuta europaea]
MVRKKSMTVEPVTVRNTRSRFSLLPNIDVEFPVLPGNGVKKPGAGFAETGGNHGSGAAELARSTSRFAVLEGMEDEFLELGGAVNGRSAATSLVANLTQEVTKAQLPKAHDIVAVNNNLRNQDNLAGSSSQVTFAEHENDLPEKNLTSKPAKVTVKNVNYGEKSKTNAVDNAIAKQADTVNGGPLEKEQKTNGDAVVIQKPWSSLFKDNRNPSNGLKLRYIPPKGTSLDFTDRILPTMVDMWGFCLVGFFTGKFPGLKAIYDLKNTWGLVAL